MEEEKLKTFRQEYVQFMRQKLQNQNIDIQTKVVRSTPKNTRKFTPVKDDFAELQEKYPLLKNLKEILGLYAG